MTMTFSAKTAAAALAAGLALTGGAAFGHTVWTPAGDTITGITGTSRSGFRVIRHDGSVAYLPTISEAVTECLSYRRQARRIRCTATVRTWYRDLGDMKRAIRYARGDGR